MDHLVGEIVIVVADIRRRERSFEEGEGLAIAGFGLGEVLGVAPEEDLAVEEGEQTATDQHTFRGMEGLQ